MVEFSKPAARFKATGPDLFSIIAQTHFRLSREQQGGGAKGRGWSCLSSCRALPGEDPCAILRTRVDELFRCLNQAWESPEVVIWAGVAQLVEHLICNQRVGGSSPFASSRVQSFGFVWSPVGWADKFCYADSHRIRTACSRIDRAGCGIAETLLQGGSRLRMESLGCAQVAERLMAADCKSAAPRSYVGSNPTLCTSAPAIKGANGCC